jgi:hypothetical protein
MLSSTCGPFLEPSLAVVIVRNKKKTRCHQRISCLQCKSRTCKDGEPPSTVPRPAIGRRACGLSVCVSAPVLCFVCLQRLESKLKHSASPVLRYLLRPRDCFEPGYLDGFTNWPLKDFVIAVTDCNVARPAAACNKKTNLNITLYLLEPRLSGILRYHGLQRVSLGFGTRFGAVNSIDGCDLALRKRTTANQEQQDR